MVLALLPEGCCLSRGTQNGTRCAPSGCRKLGSFGIPMALTPSSFTNSNRRPVWAEVSLPALAYNLRAIRDFVNPKQEKRKVPRKILSIVKGNAYGHGGPQVAKALEKAGSDWFGVTCTEEGIEVRKAGVRKPILVLTSFASGEEAPRLEHGPTAVIHRCDQLAALEPAAARPRRRRGSRARPLQVLCGLTAPG